MSIQIRRSNPVSETQEGKSPFSRKGNAITDARAVTPEHREQRKVFTCR
jgi:hypothetical protein